MHRSIYEDEHEIVQIYDLNDCEATAFPTPADFPFQFGFGVTPQAKTFQPHVHRDAERVLTKTSEFIYVIDGKMTVTFLGCDGAVLETVDFGPGMGFLQIAGGHAISTTAGTRYFELKQGPYYGREFDKYDVQVRTDGD